jgi:hypothetical protein
MLNPDNTNNYASCISCPYYTDTDPDSNNEFRGLQYDGGTHLFDCDSDDSYLQIGAFTSSCSNSYCMRGPRQKNDAGVVSYATIVELYVRPDPSGATCVDCKACFDPDGNVRMATYPVLGTNGTLNETYTAPACPDYCLEQVQPKPRASNVYAPHQLVILSNGLDELPCNKIKTYHAFNQTYTTSKVCEGKEIKITDAMPIAPMYGRIGGVFSRGFFVAPVTARYTFNVHFDDGGELWLSPNADPRAAELKLAVASGSIPVNDDKRPSHSPSLSPSHSPSRMPTHTPSPAPTLDPSGSPTFQPSRAPTASPIAKGAPSFYPSRTPSRAPSRAPSHEPSKTPSYEPTSNDDSTFLSASAMCDEWSCVGTRCFRVFFGRVSYDRAAQVCADFDGLLAGPRSFTENQLFKSLIAGQGDAVFWIGLSDREQEAHFAYSNGTYAGYATAYEKRDFPFERWFVDLLLLLNSLIFKFSSSFFFLLLFFYNY